VGSIIKLYTGSKKTVLSFPNHNQSKLAARRSESLGAMRPPSAARQKTLKKLVRVAVAATFITEIQNLLSNSKVRKVIHSGRVTFRVLANYIPHLGELTIRGHGEFQSALPGAVTGPAPRDRTG
jgi:hypothetical protein